MNISAFEHNVGMLVIQCAVHTYHWHTIGVLVTSCVAHILVFAFLYFEHSLCILSLMFQHEVSILSMMV